MKRFTEVNWKFSTPTKNDIDDLGIYDVEKSSLKLPYYSFFYFAVDLTGRFIYFTLEECLHYFKKTGKIWYSWRSLLETKNLVAYDWWEKYPDSLGVYFFPIGLTKHERLKEIFSDSVASAMLIEKALVCVKEGALPRSFVANRLMLMRDELLEMHKEYHIISKEIYKEMCKKEEV